jgi:hypothetical protein
MKTRKVLLFAAALLLLSGGVLAPPGRSQTVEPGVAPGGTYRLTSLALPSAPDIVWQVSGTCSGGHYRLSVQPAEAASGSGCCCTYLPCTMRSYQP